MGLFLKHFNSFEAACHILDMKIARQVGETPDGSTRNFQDAVEVFTKARKKDEEADSLDDGANLMLEHLVSVQDPEQAAIYHQTIQEHL